MYSLLIDISIPAVLALEVLLTGVMANQASWPSMCCAAIVFPADAFVFALIWIPHSTGDAAVWYVVPVVAMGVLVTGAVYWLVLYLYRQTYRKRYVFLVDRKPKATYVDACRRDVLISECLEQKWLSSADHTGEGPAVYLTRLDRQGDFGRQVDISLTLL